MEGTLRLLEAELGAEVVNEGPEPPPPEWWDEHPGLHIELVGSDPPDRTTEAAPASDRDGHHESAAQLPPESLAEQTDRSRRVPLSEWHKALRGADDLTATEHHVALAFAAHMNFRDEEDRPIPEAHCWPSASKLAEETHRSRATVYKALGSLEAKGWVYWERRGTSSPVIWATVPDGGDVIRFPRESHPRDTEDRGDSLTHETDSLTHETPESHPRDTEVEAEVETEVSAAPSLADDPELFEAMLDLARRKGARSPKAWVPKVFAEDIAPIIEEQGRDAALDEIRRRRSGRYRPPSTDGHGDVVTLSDDW